MRFPTMNRVLLAFAILSLFFSGPGQAADMVRVAYPSMNVSVFCIVIAQQQGYLKEEGLDVQLLNIRGEIAIRTALAGEIDYFTNAGSALAAAVRSVPVKIVTVFQDRPTWDLIAQPGIKSIQQLRGGTIGVMSPEGSLAVVAREMLRKNGLDPGKDVNLVTMGGDSVRFPALQTRSISATLFNTGMSLQAQKAGFSKLASAADYANLIEGGFAASSEKVKQNPEKIFRFIRASLKGIKFFASKREPSIKLMMENMKISDHELAGAIYDINSKLILRDGYSDDKTLQAMIETMRRTTKVTRDFKVGDIFELAFVKKANDELKAAGWKP